MESMSLVDLKKLAKGRRIKQYYIMRRAQLLELLAMPELPREMVLEKKTILQLRQEAKDRGLRGFWRMQREDLLRLLYPDTEENQKNEGHAEKHDKPESHDAKNVGVEVAEDPEEEGA
jgi:hypothetical protein